MKKLFLTLVFVLATATCFAQDAFKQDVVKYLELSGQRETFELMTKDIVNQIPAEKQADFKKELDKSLDGLMAKMADVYMEEFTHDDIKEFIKFYESPAGKKLTSKTGSLFQKAQQVGNEWGMGLQGIMMKYMQ